MFVDHGMKHRAAGPDIEDNFREVVPPLNAREARVEANRCLFCDDAPCTKACPTSIDVPMFISQIATGNLIGSGKTIFDSNPLGASCARVCPTEELCVGACVLNDLTVPIMIGELQRYATDAVVSRDISLYEPGPPNGRKVAIVGAGPAGLGAARELARLGYQVTMFDAKDKPGGLNTYGVVPYRLPQNVALWEVEQVKKLGVEIRQNVRVGRDIAADDLVNGYDAVVLAVGMGRIQKLGVPGETLEGVIDALDLVEQTKDGNPLDVKIGQRIVVVGGGNTAIDAATASRRLGAETVQMLYRRSQNEMSAYAFEYDFAKRDGVEFRWLTTVTRILGAKRVQAVECVKMKLGSADASGRLTPSVIAGSEFVIPADNVIVAIGQDHYLQLLRDFKLYQNKGVISIDENMRTSREKVYSAGDCVFDGHGADATVVRSVEQGKRAAAAIHRDLFGDTKTLVG